MRGAQLANEYIYIYILVLFSVILALNDGPMYYPCTGLCLAYIMLGSNILIPNPFFNFLKLLIP